MLAALRRMVAEEVVDWMRQAAWRWTLQCQDICRVLEVAVAVQAENSDFLYCLCLLFNNISCLYCSVLCYYLGLVQVQLGDNEHTNGLVQARCHSKALLVWAPIEGHNGL